MREQGGHEGRPLRAPSPWQPPRFGSALWPKCYTDRGRPMLPSAHRWWV